MGTQCCEGQDRAAGALGGQTLWQTAVLGQPGQPLRLPFPLTMRIAFEAQGGKDSLFACFPVNQLRTH